MPAGRRTEKNRTELGERIASARQERGLSQEDLAKQLGVTRRMIAWWERQPVALRVDQLVALADALDISTDALLGRKQLRPRGAGPVGKIRKLFEAVSDLPRHHQEKIAAVIEPFVVQHRPSAPREP